MPVNAAVWSQHIGPPFEGDKVGWSVGGYHAALGGVELVEYRHRLQEGIRLLHRLEGHSLQEGRGTLPQIPIPRLEEIKVAIVQGPDQPVRFVGSPP